MTRDPLEEMMSRDAGIRELVEALASAPTEAELAREPVALATFRAFDPAQAGAQAQSRRVRAPRSHRARKSFRFGVRLAVTATVVTLLSGFTVASYAAALPPSLQRIVYQFLGSFGVPDAVGSLPATHASPSASASETPGRSRHHHRNAGSQAPGHSHSQPASPSPSPRHHVRHHQPTRPAPHRHGGLTLSPATSRVQAGASMRFTATLDVHGRPQPNVPLRLLRLPAWPPHGQWQPLGSATTNQQGQASFYASFLWTNTSFEVTGPGSAHSRKVRIVVIPQVLARILSGGGQGHGPDQPFVLVSCHEAAPGDTVKLEVRGHGGHWKVVSTTRVRHFGWTAFPIEASQANRTYRAVLLASKLHGRAASMPVSGKNGSHGHHWHHWHQWSPSPTPHPTPTPSGG